MESGEPELPDGPEEPAEKAKRLRRLALRVDTQPALLTAAEALRRRLPGDERFGDPLSTAGTQTVEVVARGVSALQPQRKSLAQELGLAGLQVWQSLSEAAGRGHGGREMAIMFTDLVGFSGWALKAGDAATLELLRAVGTSVEAAVSENDGRIVKRLGDGLMATFLAPRPAIDAALAAQAAVGLIDLDGHTPRMRAGIHWGSPRKLGGDYLGVDVNIAARVSAAAKADQVLVSEALLARIDLQGLSVGRAKRLRAEGAPRDLHVVQIDRA
ncbi:MAG: adenylate/guanylate cyclase domain-containing protein [Solirubrobacteraceae bacterium]